MMQNIEVAKSSRPSKASKNLAAEIPDLPSFVERLPLFFTEAERVAQGLCNLSAQQSYLWVWEKLYDCVHSLKGLTNILYCPAELAEEIRELSDTVALAVMGDYVVQDAAAAAEYLRGIAQALSSGKPCADWIRKLHSTYQEDRSHSQRMQKIANPFQQINPLISKKAYEAFKLGFSTQVLQEEIPLEIFPDWTKKVLKALDATTASHGVLIHASPQLSTSQGNKIIALAWFAAPAKKMAAVLKSLSKNLPRSSIRKS